MILCEYLLDRVLPLSAAGLHSHSTNWQKNWHKNENALFRIHSWILCHRGDGSFQLPPGTLELLLIDGRIQKLCW